MLCSSPAQAQGIDAELPGYYEKDGDAIKQLKVNANLALFFFANEAELDFDLESDAAWGCLWDMNMAGLSCRNAIGCATCLLLKCYMMIANFDFDLNQACTAYLLEFATLQQGLQGTHPRTKWPFEMIDVFQRHVYVPSCMLQQIGGWECLCMGCCCQDSWC